MSALLVHSVRGPWAYAAFSLPAGACQSSRHTMAQRRNENGGELPSTHTQGTQTDSESGRISLSWSVKPGPKAFFAATIGTSPA